MPRCLWTLGEVFNDPMIVAGPLRDLKASPGQVEAQISDQFSSFLDCLHTVETVVHIKTGVDHVSDLSGCFRLRCMSLECVDRAAGTACGPEGKYLPLVEGWFGIGGVLSPDEAQQGLVE